MQIADSRIFAIDQFTIRQKPLDSNPAFATHLIYLAGKLIGRQLSVPTLDDCKWHQVKAGQYAKPEESWKPGSFGGKVLRGRERNK